MKIYRNSHHKGFIEPNFNSSKSTYPSFNHKFFKKFQGETFKLSPSDVVIFNPFTIHQSTPNKSSKIRFTMTVEFHGITLHEDQKLTEKFNSIKKMRIDRRKINNF